MGLSNANPNRQRDNPYAHTWKPGEEVEVRAGHYATLIHQKHAWRLFALDEGRGKHLVAGLSCQGGIPVVPLGVGQALWSTRPYATVNFGEPKTYEFHGKLPWSTTEYRAAGEKFFTRAERRKSFLKGGDVTLEARIISQKTERSYSTAELEEVAFSLRGAEEIIEAAENFVLTGTLFDLATARTRLIARLLDCNAENETRSNRTSCENPKDMNETTVMSTPPKTKSREYSTSIVGESFYQRTIRTLEEGDEVYIVRERGNPYDRQALCIRTVDDEPIGYLAKDNWMRRALIDEGRGCSAWIDTIAAAGSGDLGVRLGVELTDGPCEERQYVRR